MRSTGRCAALCLLLFAASGFAARAVKAQKAVHQVEIRSQWGGLGPHAEAEVIIRSKNDGFVSSDKRVDPARVQALLTALEAPQIDKPEMANLGITPEWLKASVAAQHPREFAQALATTENQRALFATSFTNTELIAKVLPRLFTFVGFDDYPYVEVVIIFEDGSELSARSHSQYLYMLPWSVGGDGGETFNADISRAVSELLPLKTVNKERLAGVGLLHDLVDWVMRSIEGEWNLIGSQDLAGDALAKLRGGGYVVTAAKMDPLYSPEMNLHVTVRKAAFPPNVSDVLVLPYVKGTTEGAEEFLKTSEKYEDMALSLPWLSEYLKANPRVQVVISYVHNVSFDDKAMRSFAADMKARGREDLVDQVRAQQSEITLLLIADSYWLLFPDKHMMLWRYDAPTGLLKWSATDFPPAKCGSYETNYSGCSGREVAADGELAPEHAHRDLECMAAHRAEQSNSVPRPEELFPVMDHDRAGFINRTGKVVIPLCFDDVGAFSEGLARFQRDGSWGYIDANGSVVIEPKFPWAQEFSEGLARVQVTTSPLNSRGRWGFIDKTGNLVIPANFGDSFATHTDMGSDDSEDSFHDGLARVRVDDRTDPGHESFHVGFINKTGKLAIPADFGEALAFSEGMAAATEPTSPDHRWGYIDKSGAWIVPPQFDSISSFQEHLAGVNRIAVNLIRECGYIDATGALVLRPPVSPGEKGCFMEWGDFADGLSRWAFGKKYGYINRTGKFAIKPRFDATSQFSEGLAAVMIHKKWGYIDKAGKMVIAPHFQQAQDFHHGLAFVETSDGKWGYIDKSGKYVWTPTLLYNN